MSEQVIGLLIGLGTVGVAFGAVFGIPPVIARVRRRRFARLRSWELDGIPLPSPDDPRWYETHGMRCGRFSMDAFACIYLDGAVLGRYDLYYNYVRKRLLEFDRAELADRALKALTDD